MIRITADLYSGRPNPSWVLADESEARALVKAAVANRQTASASAALGFRGFSVEPLTDDAIHTAELQSSLYIPAATTASSQSSELIDRLLTLVSHPVSTLEAAASEGEDVVAYIRQQVASPHRASELDMSPGASLASEASFEAAVTCGIETAAYNPGWWNNNPQILRNNNCYNYASNKRTDTFAQPGRGCGHMYTAITCPEVTRASLCDGLHRRFDCFPPTEAPRYLVAMVVAPGPGFVDFHWYRKNTEPFWSHKPGSTPVRNVDNSGRVITDPATCNRGPYNQFCGYFYTCKSQKIR